MHKLETAYINSNGKDSEGERICYDANGKPYVTTCEQLSFETPPLFTLEAFEPTPDNPCPGMNMNDIEAVQNGHTLPNLEDEEGIVIEVDEHGNEVRNLHIDLSDAVCDPNRNPVDELPAAIQRALSKGVVSAPAKSVSDGTYRYTVFKPREQQQMMQNQQPYMNPYGNQPMFTTNQQGYAVNVPMFTTNQQGYAVNVPMFNTAPQQQYQPVYNNNQLLFNTNGIPVNPIISEEFQERVLNGDLRNPYAPGCFFWAEWNRQVECIRLGVQQQIKYEYFDPTAYVAGANGMFYYNPERAKELKQKAYDEFVMKNMLKAKIGFRMLGKEFDEDEFMARYYPKTEQIKKTPEDIEDDKAWELVNRARWYEYNTDQWQLDPYKRRALIMQQYIYNYHQAFDHMHLLQFFNEEAWKILRDIWIQENVMSPREARVAILKKRLTQMPDLKHMARLTMTGPAVDNPAYKELYEKFRLAKARNVMKLVEERSKGSNPVNPRVVEDFLNRFKTSDVIDVDRSL